MPNVPRGQIIDNVARPNLVTGSMPERKYIGPQKPDTGPPIGSQVAALGRGLSALGDDFKRRAEAEQRSTDAAFVQKGLNELKNKTSEYEAIFKKENEFTPDNLGPKFKGWLDNEIEVASQSLPERTRADFKLMAQTWQTGQLDSIRDFEAIKKQELKELANKENFILTKDSIARSAKSGDIEGALAAWASYSASESAMNQNDPFLKAKQVLEKDAFFQLFLSEAVASNPYFFDQLKDNPEIKKLPSTFLKSEEKKARVEIERRTEKNKEEIKQARISNAYSKTRLAFGLDVDNVQPEAFDAAIDSLENPETQKKLGLDLNEAVFIINQIKADSSQEMVKAKRAKTALIENVGAQIVDSLVVGNYSDAAKLATNQSDLDYKTRLDFINTVQDAINLKASTSTARQKTISDNQATLVLSGIYNGTITDKKQILDFIGKGLDPAKISSLNSELEKHSNDFIGGKNYYQMFDSWLTDNLDKDNKGDKQDYLRQAQWLMKKNGWTINSPELYDAAKRLQDEIDIEKGWFNDIEVVPFDLFKKEMPWATGQESGKVSMTAEMVSLGAEAAEIKEVYDIIKKHNIRPTYANKENILMQIRNKKAK